MTLNTKIRALSPINPREIHDWANQELLKVKNPKMDVGEFEIWNQGGQGFDAWLITSHNGGKPFEFQLMLGADSDFYREHPEDIEEERQAFDAEPVGYVDLAFDTAYGYRSPSGMGCTQLHALYIVRLIDKFAEMGSELAWHNEYTCEWHYGAEGLEQFAGNGVKAMNWFQSTALPAIQAATRVEPRV